jgi:hypothetical protein
MPVLRLRTPPGNPAYGYRCIIEGVTYGIRLRWFSRAGVWRFSLYDAARQAIREERRINEGLSLLWRCRDPRRPPGDFFLVGPSTDPTLLSLGADHLLLYAGVADQLKNAVFTSADAAVQIEEVP